MGLLKMKYSPYQYNQSKHPSKVENQLAHVGGLQHFLI